jgi:putative zinc finger/helix-turn-helix YgiT family protein
MMVSPFTGGVVREVPDTQLYTFRGEQYEVTAPVYQCVDTGEQFTTNEQDEEFLSRLHAQWRAKHDVPTPERLRTRRDELGLSAREMSALLGFGVNQIRQYEAGEVPSGSNVLLLQMICTQSGLTAVLEQQQRLLPERTLRKLRDALHTEVSVPTVLLTPTSHSLSREQVQELLGRQGGMLPLDVYMVRPTKNEKSMAY